MTTEPLGAVITIEGVDTNRYEGTMRLGGGKVRLEYAESGGAFERTTLTSLAPDRLVIDRSGQMDMRLTLIEGRTTVMEIGGAKMNVEAREVRCETDGETARITLDYTVDGDARVRLTITGGIR